MKNKITLIFLFIIITIAIFIQKCYANGVFVKGNKTEVNPGETVELYINLPIKSIGYDIKISIDNSEIIENSELISTIGKGNLSRIYLVQIGAESERKIYEVGTRIATIKYKVLDSTKEGEKLTINVSGNIAGKSSSERNSIQDSFTYIVKKSNSKVEKDDENKQEEDSGEMKQPEEDEKTNGESDDNSSTDKIEKKVDNLDGKIENKENSSINRIEQEENFVNNEIEEERKDNTMSKKKLPKTGGVCFFVIMLIVVCLIFVFKNIQNLLKKPPK